MAMGIYVIRDEAAEPTDPPEDVGVIIKGAEVLQDLGDVANGCAVLRDTFEFLQKVLMELDGKRLSTKVQVLKNITSIT